MKKKEEARQFPKNQDHLEVYPEKKQVSAFPEKRFIKTNRTLAIIILINLACIIAGAGLFIYSTNHMKLNIEGKQGIHIYQIDPEEKTLKPVQKEKIKIPAKHLIIEQALYKYIKDRHEGILNQEIMKNKINNGYAVKLSENKIKETVTMNLTELSEKIQRQRFSRDIHIYNLHLLHGNIWTAVIETFDFPETDNLLPQCACSDNSVECLKCKNKHTIYKERRRIWIRVSLKGKKTIDNPFGIQIEGYHIGYLPNIQENTQWDLPSELTPVFGYH